jgi:hypothetical protein
MQQDLLRGLLALQEPEQLLRVPNHLPFRIRSRSGRRVPQYAELRVELLEPIGVGERGSHHVDRDRAALWIDAGESDLISGRPILVVGAHPLDQPDDLLGLPDPEPQTADDTRRVTDPVPDVGVDRGSGGLARLHREHREPELGHEVLEQPVLQLEELPRPMGRLPQPDHPYSVERLPQRTQIVDRRTGDHPRQRPRVLRQPVPYFGRALVRHRESLSRRPDQHAVTRT